MSHWEMLQVYQAKEKIVLEAVKWIKELEATGSANSNDLERAVLALLKLSKDYD